MAHHRCIADLPDQPAQWLWPGRIPRGAVTLVIGDAGRGKSLLTLDMAARVTAGRAWPDGAPAASPGNVLLLSAEDSLMRTVRNRLVALGADLKRVHYLNAGQWSSATQPPHPRMRDSICRTTTFGFVPTYIYEAMRSDAHHLKLAVESMHDCRLVVIDPIPAYLHDLAGAEPEDSRPVLAALSAIADITGAAIVAVAHRDQLTNFRNKGQQAPIRNLAALARSIYLVDRLPDDLGRSALITVKCNLGAKQPPLAFEVQSDAIGAPSIQWSPAPADFVPEGLQDSSSAQNAPVRRLTETDRAVAWLQGALAAGPVPSLELTQRAIAAGISCRTFKRARARLGVQASKASRVGAAWECALPNPNSPRIREGQFSDLADLALLAHSVINQTAATSPPEASSSNPAA
jgi:putative DNA primase/helicase